MKKTLVALTLLSSIPAYAHHTNVAYEIDPTGGIVLMSNSGEINGYYGFSAVSINPETGRPDYQNAIPLYDFVSQSCVEEYVMPDINEVVLPENFSSNRSFNIEKLQYHIQFLNRTNNERIEFYQQAREHGIQFDERNCPVVDGDFLRTDRQAEDSYNFKEKRDQWLSATTSPFAQLKKKYIPCEGADLNILLDTVAEYTKYKQNRFPSDLSDYPILKERTQATGDAPKKHAIGFLKAWNNTMREITIISDLEQDMFNDVRNINEDTHWSPGEISETMPPMAKLNKVVNDHYAKINVYTSEYYRYFKILGTTEAPYGIEHACLFDLETKDDPLLEIYNML